MSIAVLDETEPAVPKGGISRLQGKEEDGELEPWLSDDGVVDISTLGTGTDCKNRGCLYQI